MAAATETPGAPPHFPPATSPTAQTKVLETTAPLPTSMTDRRATHAATHSTLRPRTKTPGTTTQRVTATANAIRMTETTAAQMIGVPRATIEMTIGAEGLVKTETGETTRAAAGTSTGEAVLVKGAGIDATRQTAETTGKTSIHSNSVSMAVKSVGTTTSGHGTRARR